MEGVGHMKSNIALIGFMGTGKSAVGSELSKRLGIALLEVDELIVEKAGKSITEIFSEDGEEAFRRLESEVVADVSSRNGVIISCGGGAVLDPENVMRLKMNSVIVLLTAPVDEILRRAFLDGDSRPLLNTFDKEARARELLRYRQSFYLRAADYILDTSGLDPEGVAETIISLLSEEP